MGSRVPAAHYHPEIPNVPPPPPGFTPQNNFRLRRMLDAGLISILVEDTIIQKQKQTKAKQQNVAY